MVDRLAVEAAAAQAGRSGEHLGNPGEMWAV
jgi:hypothetical protein